MALPDERWPVPARAPGERQPALCGIAVQDLLCTRIGWIGAGAVGIPDLILGADRRAQVANAGAIVTGAMHAPLQLGPRLRVLLRRLHARPPGAAG